MDDEEITDVSCLHEIKLNPIHKLHFAKFILTGTGMLFFSGMAITCFTANDKILDACKTILPPFASLIIGYYFSEKNTQ